MSSLVGLARRPEPWAAAAGLTSVVLSLPAALFGWPLPWAVGLLGLYVADALLYAGPEPALPRWLGRREMGATDRALFRESVAVLGWLQFADPSPTQVVVVVAAVVVVQAAHAAYRVVTGRNTRRRRGRIAWRNLDVGGHTEGPGSLPPTVPALGPVAGGRTVLLADLGVVVGVAVGWLADSTRAPLVGAAVTGVLAGAVLVRLVTRTALIRRLPTPKQENAALVGALDDHGPRVAVYFSGGPDTTYQLNVWLETVDRLHQPAVIILREARHLEAMLPTRTPVIVLPRATDVEEYTPPSVRVALYPTTVIKNNHMIRLAGLRHVFINHGDGDKSVTYSPLHRVFDEIWVAGQAACDRYLTKGEGIRAEQLRQVGRPQLAHITPMAPREGRRRTVLYAPTWEGNFDGVDYSSVAPMGLATVRALLDPALDVRVLFKAHPATGTRLPAAREAREAIELAIHQAGGDHEVVGGEPDSLYRAFNDADVLISDISSVVADFLASRKPYLVTNPGGRSTADYHAQFPSTAGGGLLDGDPAVLRAALADALGPDTLRERREALATYFLGPPVADPLERFAQEVDAVLARTPHLAHVLPNDGGEEL